MNVFKYDITTFPDSNFACTNAKYTDALIIKAKQAAKRFKSEKYYLQYVHYLSNSR